MSPGILGTTPGDARMGVGTDTALDAAYERIEAQEAEIDRLRAALKFYADVKRYDYDETCCPAGKNPGRKKIGEDVLSDDGEMARAALAEKED